LVGWVVNVFSSNIVLLNHFSTYSKNVRCVCQKVTLSCGLVYNQFLQYMIIYIMIIQMNIVSNYIKCTSNISNNMISGLRTFNFPYAENFPNNN
jgi:hypothetical protein